MGTHEYFPCLTTDIFGVRHYILNFEQVNDFIKIAFTTSHGEAMRLMNYNGEPGLSCDALEAQGCNIATVKSLYEFLYLISLTYERMRKILGDKFDSWMFEQSL